MVESIELNPYNGVAYNGDSSATSDESKHRKSVKNDDFKYSQDICSENGSMYGKLHTSEVKRELKARHISMISLGGTIGTGLFISTRVPLSQAGPVGSLIAYIFMGTIAYFVTQSLGEMATFIPVTSSFTVFSKRFLSPALGATSGYLYWFSWCVTFALELSVIGELIRYWTTAVPLAVWITVFWVLLAGLNMFPVKYYGEIEFWVASVKVVSILGFILYAFIMVCGGGPNGTFGFRYWKDPGPFGTGIISSNLGEARFLSWVSSLIKAAFTYQGTELVGITAGESKNPRKAVPRAINQVFFRILFFYILSLLFIGLLIPYDDPRLLASDDTDMNSSPFVISIKNAGTKILPDIFNAVILVTIISAGNSNVYIASRVLYGLSSNNLAPKIFTKTNKSGVPYFSVLVSAAFGVLAYLNVSDHAVKAFDWLVNITAVAGFFTWLLISLSHIRFMQVLKDRGISRNDLPFKANLMPWGAYYSSFFIVVIILTQGMEAFAPKFSFPDFIAYYISLFIFIVCFVIFQFFVFRNRIIHTKDDVDIDTDRREIDDMVWIEDETPKTIWGKIWKIIT
ncbi:HCL606Cp [Eremothecium sinecaudum]|uniref:HCL606Cp n=1 Tax=Eremothecium sinecaudum TaxID=45286 RepID=A0A120K1M4_9SACH|nr:HCL606Cp [Eremothecium sinecaudum]AMD19545.1 HCL606Cp [Eremothecium sinecaudum]